MLVRYSKDKTIKNIFKLKEIIYKNNLYKNNNNKLNLSGFIYSFFYIQNNSMRSSYSHLYLLSVYLSFFLKTYTSVQLHWQFLNLNIKPKNKLIYMVWRKTYKKQFLRNFFCSSWFYLYLLIKIFFFRDVSLFSTLCSKIIKRYHLKKHKRLFKLTGDILNSFLELNSEKKYLRGFRLYFKGKLGRKGSVRKSTFYMNKGQISFTNKMLRYNYKHFLIPTETGVVGCYMAIFF